MYPIENFKIPHDCYQIESALENIAYGQFATLHHNQDPYNKLVALLEETHKILDCDDKILDAQKKLSLGQQGEDHIYHQYYMMQRHYEHCPEITSYLDENKNIDPAQLSTHQQETLNVIQEMGRDLQCNQECYKVFDILETYSHKK
jgi:hypothetical protein